MFVTRVLIVACAVITQINGASIPSYIQLCKRRDPNLNKCYLKGFNTVLQHLGNGIPELRLRKFEPVLIQKILVDRETSSLAIDGELTNTRVFGLTSGKATAVDINLDKFTFNITMEIPSIFMESNYLGQGKLFSFPIVSKGTFNGTITGITGSGVWIAEKEIKNGQTWLRNFKNQQLSLDIKDIKMYFDNLVPNKQINDETNRSINENIDLLYKDVSPIIKSTINAVLNDAANSVYSVFPLETLYPE